MKIEVDDNLTITFLERSKPGVYGFFKSHKCRECGARLSHHSDRKVPLCHSCSAKYVGILTNVIRRTIDRAVGCPAYDYLQKTGKKAEWLDV